MRLGSIVLFGTVAWAAVPTSPRIETFSEALRTQQAGASERFWSEAQRDGGTPLIECPRKLTPDCLVTFLWRGDASTRNVVVRAEALPGPAAEHVFDHLPDTDVWYRTYRFRNDVRFMYMLSINDPLTSWEVEGPQRPARYAGLRTDPLNQRNAGYVSLPLAPSERWSEKRPDTVHGDIRRYPRASAAMSGKRVIEVYATPGFQRGQGLTPVLLLFDGDESRDLLKVPIILDNLYAEHRIGAMLAVFLLQPYEHRETDLECSQNTNLYLVTELLPWLREQYEIRTAPGQTVAAGASLGGLAATYAALQRKGYSVTYREFNGTHGFPCWRAGFADALTALLSH